MVSRAFECPMLCDPTGLSGNTFLACVFAPNWAVPFIGCMTYGIFHTICVVARRTRDAGLRSYDGWLRLKERAFAGGSISAAAGVRSMLRQVFIEDSPCNQSARFIAPSIVRCSPSSNCP
jgi:hypothetical protein